MTEEKKYTLEEANKKFAIELNGRVWTLLDKETRTEEDNDEMIHAAHASCYHWSKVGTAINIQRGHWMISRVYSVLNIPEAALFHAKKCMELTEEHNFVDFDLAFAYEAMARANACAGNHNEAQKFNNLANDAGENIKLDEDREIFVADFANGPWYGLK